MADKDRKEFITNIPKESLGDVVELYTRIGAKVITKEEQAGRFSVEAKIPLSGTYPVSGVNIFVPKKSSG